MCVIQLFGMETVDRACTVECCETVNQDVT